MKILKKIIAIVAVVSVALMTFAVPLFADSGNRFGQAYYADNAPESLMWYREDNQGYLNLVTAANPFVYTLSEDVVGTFRDRIFTYTVSGTSVNLEVEYVANFSDPFGVSVLSSASGTNLKNALGTLDRGRTYLTMYFRDFFVPKNDYFYPEYIFTFSGDMEYYTGVYPGNDTDRYSIYQYVITYRTYDVTPTGEIVKSDVKTYQDFMRGEYDETSDTTTVGFSLNPVLLNKMFGDRTRDILISDMYIDFIPMTPSGFDETTVAPASITFRHYYDKVPNNHLYDFYEKYDEVSDDDKNFVTWVFTAVGDVFVAPLFYVGDVPVNIMSILSLSVGLGLFIWFIKLFAGG